MPDAVSWLWPLSCRNFAGGYAGLRRTLRRPVCGIFALFAHFLTDLREFLLAVDFGRAAVFGGEAFEEGAPVYEARLVDDLVDRELRGREQLFGLG